MKRSAAIIGPTPPFLRWTIALPCPFRDPEAKCLADAAFRELRSLRAIAVGEIEGRIVDGICVHPDAAAGEIDQAKGFPIAEVYAAYGGEENAQAACDGCPANVPVCDSELSGGGRLSKAGCFGWLPFDVDGSDAGDSPGFMGLMESGKSGSGSIVELFESALNSIAEPCPFPKTSPAWFGVWSQKKFLAPQLKFLAGVCDQVKSDSIAWRRLAVAVRVSLEHGLDLRVDLTPSGFSDGTWWKIHSSCATCGVSAPKTPCEVCGSSAAILRERKTKVLGLRPYLNLVSIVGEEATKRLIGKL